jgi:Flp pilus assembly protein TadG
MYRVSTPSTGGSTAPESQKTVAQTWPIAGSFARDNRGSVAILMGLMVFIMMSLLGLTVDLGRWMLARKQTQEAIDTAALAGLKKYQETSSESQALATANVNFEFSKPKGDGIQGTVSFKLIESNTAMTVAASTLTVDTPFMRIAGVEKLPILKAGTSEYAITKLGVGQNTGTSLEVSVMIDITGSMNESDNKGSTKLEAVKSAATSMVDLLVWDDQSQYTSKVAIVPFSEGVRLTQAQADLAHGVTPNTTTTAPGTKYFNYQIKNNKGQVTSTTKYTNDDLCVTERTGADKFTDASPATAKVGRYYSKDGVCDTKTVVMPLSSDKNALKARIESLVGSGNTAGQMGTAWAWYMLSPNFNSLWPASSAARPYSDMQSLNSQGQPILRKIAVLMTDGTYNTAYCDGRSYWDGQCSSPTNGSSSSQALALCTAMKAKGITVYTVGAQVGTAEKALLEQCATTPSHFYDATDGNKLRQAFIDIAYKLVPPFIAH